MDWSKKAVYISHLTKNYKFDKVRIEALKDVSLTVERGESVSIVGPSGAGKTTLLNIIGGIDKATSGEVFVLGKDLTILKESALADFRCQNVGFVFQSYNLVSTLTVSENIAFPMEWTRKPEDYIRKHTGELLQLVSLEHRSGHFPSQLSGGEQQRVAFARALANDPPLLLVDEPTGNLDRETGLKIVELLEKLKRDGKTIIVATHDDQIIQLADKNLHLEMGELAETDE